MRTMASLWRPSDCSIWACAEKEAPKRIKELTIAKEIPLFCMSKYPRDVCCLVSVVCEQLSLIFNMLVKIVKFLEKDLVQKGANGVQKGARRVQREDLEEGKLMSWRRFALTYAPSKAGPYSRSGNLRRNFRLDVDK